MEMIQITICPSCGSDNIRKICKNWNGKFKGQNYTVPSLEFYECSDCDEKLYDRVSMRKTEAYSPAFSGSPRKQDMFQIPTVLEAEAA